MFSMPTAIGVVQAVIEKGLACMWHLACIMVAFLLFFFYFATL